MHGKPSMNGNTCIEQERDGFFLRTNTRVLKALQVVLRYGWACEVICYFVFSINGLSRAKRFKYSNRLITHCGHMIESKTYHNFDQWHQAFSSIYSVKLGRCESTLVIILAKDSRSVTWYWLISKLLFYCLQPETEFSAVQLYYFVTLKHSNLAGNNLWLVFSPDNPCGEKLKHYHRYGSESVLYLWTYTWLVLTASAWW